MDDPKPANEPSEQGLNKLDLTQLQSFNFGTQWTEVKPISPGGRRERDDDRGAGRGDRRDRPGLGAGAPSRDRRGFRKPLGAPGGAPAGAPPMGDRPPQGDGQRRFDRGPGPGGPSGPGGPRRDFRGGPGGERREGGGQQFDRAPYISPYFVATCYPEDTGFAAIVKAVRASCRTFQLFEITKAVLEKNDRFVVVVQRARPPAGEGQSAKPEPMYMSLPDHLPFDTEDAAIQHALGTNMASFFDTQDVEIEAPKGNYPIINKCGITGDLLGPPNYHRYQQILQQHYAAKIKGMSFDRFRDSIVSVREPEVAAAWLEKMKKATRYTWKPPVAKASVTTPPTEAGAPVSAEPVADKPAEVQPAEATAPVDAAAPAADASTSATPATEQPVAPAAEAPASAEPAADQPAAISFDNIEDARIYLLTHARDKVVRAVESVRFHGKNIEKLPQGEIHRALEGHVERQRRFPLDTANALRGRLRREGFTIFKKGARGVSYVCAVKRRFRVPGQVFSETISALIDFIEKNPMVSVKDLPKGYLGFEVAAAPAPVSAEPATGTPAEGSTPSQAPFAALPPEQTEKLRKMSNDLRWLVMEGYVTEFSDGKLFAPPVMAPQAAKKAESGDDEHDPEDFPEAPVSAQPAAAKPTESEPAPVAAPAPVVEAAPAPEEAAPAPEEPKPESQA